ncbi:thrombospondin type-1 domain-containing protein 7B [Aplochiton taeniatus]
MGWTMILKDYFGVIARTWRAGNNLFLLLSLLALQVHSDIDFHKDQHFKWKTGQWGRCMGEECGSGGVQTRTMWCVHSEGWTTHHSNCHQADKPESQRPCFKVCEWHQDLFEWEVSEWASCVLVPFFSNELKLRTAECITAQHGIQRRKVQCVRTSNRTVVTSRICEFFSQKPTVEQACLIPCPQDCVVSDFTSWSSCSKTCSVGLQHRTRHVLATPMYGGSNCPNLTETRTCSNPTVCPAGESEYQYSLKVGPWSECRLPHHKGLLHNGRTTLDFSPGSKEKSTEKNTVKRHTQTDPHLHHHQQHSSPHQQNPKWWDVEVGYQTRQVRCTRSDGKNAMLSLCTQDDTPLTFQSCVMPKDCDTSDWSSWSPCSKTCRAADLSPGYRIRTRIVTQIPIGGGNDCPTLEEKEACNIIGDLLPNCPRYVWKTTDWGECRVAPLLSQQDRRLGNLSVLCGGGIQTRETYCVQVPDNSVLIPRKEVSRPVSQRLCSGREILLSVQHCSILCQQDCILSPWSSWGACLHESCLEPQGRKGKGVPRAQCEDDPPPMAVLCRVACPGDCVVGTWSAWSTCSHSCTNKKAEGRQSRTRRVLALPGEGGDECPAAPALEEWRSCNDHPCIMFYWEASAWGACVEDTSEGLNGSSVGNRSTTCAVGVQSRRVHCMKMNVGQVTPKRCPDSARLETIRPCLLPCKKDCIVTPFSEWTACPSTCQSANATQATQSRYRTIIQRSANEGNECPDTLYEERECEALPVCPVYRWQKHKWHTCTLVPDSVRQGMAGPVESCGNGLETRGVSCVGEDGEPADMTQCLQWAGTVPPRIRGCRVACRDDCTFTEWSKFTECLGCGSLRNRKRSLTGRSKKKERCLREDLHPLVETETCPCDDFLSQPFGNWSSCLLPKTPPPGSLQGWTTHREAKECGQGLRYRAVACVDQQGRLVSPTLCSESGYLVEVCHIPCPLDCKLSDWSPWAPCSAPCGSGLKIRSKWLREKSFNGGRPCPKLDLKNQVYEAVPCHSECNRYEWRREPWSVCALNGLDGLPDCGEGVQSRKIRCVRKEVDGNEAAIVDNSLCDQEEMPREAQTCFLPCPEDCVMSNWGPWGLCALPCDQAAVRNRTRHVLRLQASDGPCPDHVQSELCLLNTNCYTYQYYVSDWSTCQLSENAVCGQGSRSRLPDCVRSDGKLVEMTLCEEFGLVNTWRLSESCVVDCPVSCVLSDWSPWAECSHTCGNQGQTVRSRIVQQQAHEEGRPCPPLLTQTKPCPIQPCYTWLLGDWSACHVEGAECGEGVRLRNLSCMVHWGDWPESPSAKPVDEELCGDKLRKESEQELQLPCSVPCPGDCHLTEWSTWSSCQLSCLEGRSFQTTGRQARSRATVIQVMENQDNCSHQVFETRPCKGGKCHSYEWKTGGWGDNERAVWCQRSDGVNVTGGCFLQNRPATVRHCHPPCTKPFSHCTPSGVCGCEKGYTEVMTTHGFLDYCTKTPGKDIKKADVKTSSDRLKPGPSQVQDFFGEWTLRPVWPDGRIKLWVYGVTAGGFIIILFIIALSFLVCKHPTTTKTSSPPQKPLTLAYDGDVDM